MSTDVETKRPPEFDFDIDLGDEVEVQPMHAHVARIRDRIAPLWHYRGWLMKWTLAVILLTLGLGFLQRNEYTAVTYLNPPSMNPVSGMSILIGMKSGLSAGLGGAMGDMLGMNSPGQVYIRQLQSRPVQDNLIKRFNLKQVYRSKTLEDTRNSLEKRSGFKEDHKSGVISIEVTDKDPNRAAQMANAYAEELGNLTANMNAEAGRHEREYFESQLLAAEKDWQAAEARLSEFGQKNAAVDVEEEGKALITSAATIEGQLVAAESELKGLQEIYAPQHERVQAAQARIAELRRQLAQMSGKSPATNGNAAGTSDSDLDLKHLWGLSGPYAELYGQVKFKEAIVETLTQQYEISKLQETRHVNEIQIMDPAQAPEKKSGPHRVQRALAVGVLFFCVLCLWIVIAEWWDTTSSHNPWKHILIPPVEALAVVIRRAEQRFHLTSLGHLLRWTFQRKHAPGAVVVGALEPLDRL